MDTILHKCTFLELLANQSRLIFYHLSDESLDSIRKFLSIESRRFLSLIMIGLTNDHFMILTNQKFLVKGIKGDYYVRHYVRHIKNCVSI